MEFDLIYPEPPPGPCACVLFPSDFENAPRTTGCPVHDDTKDEHSHWMTVGEYYHHSHAAGYADHTHMPSELSKEELLGIPASVKLL